MSQEKDQSLLSRVVLFRSGGLGDILLTIPLLWILKQKFKEVFVVTPSKYHFLLKEYDGELSIHDLDDIDNSCEVLVENSMVISFWKDKEWIETMRSRGVATIISLEARPKLGPHFSVSLFNHLGWSISKEQLNQVWLPINKQFSGQPLRTLWIHPGSGSPKKNLSIDRYYEFAQKWLSQSSEKRVFFSFGEADSSIYEKFIHSSLNKNPRVDSVLYENLRVFCDDLRNRADVFMGNDSGPAHLAAMSGIPSHVWFRSTSPKIWSPLGSRVEIYEDESLPRRIL